MFVKYIIQIIFQKKELKKKKQLKRKLKKKDKYRRDIQNIKPKKNKKKKT